MLLLFLACGERDTGVEDSLADCASIEADTGVQVGVIEPECRCFEPALEIGTGLEVYEEIVDDSLTMVHGPQGGWHLPAAVRVHNTRNVVAIQATVTDVETGIPVTTELSYRVQVVDEGSCSGVYTNMFLYLDTGALDEEGNPATSLSCRMVDIEMCADDTGGHEACATRRVFVEPDPVDVASAQAPECESADEGG
jgi:hypothetical protein